LGERIRSTDREKEIAFTDAHIDGGVFLFCAFRASLFHAAEESTNSLPGKRRKTDAAIKEIPYA